MKNLIWLFSLIILIATSCGETVDYPYLDVKGDVDMVIDRTYRPTIEYGEWIASDELKDGGIVTYIFNKKNKIERILLRDAPNELKYKLEYRYRGDKVIDIITYDKDLNKIGITKLKYFGKDSIKFTSNNYNGDGDEYSYIQRYNPHRNLLKRTIFENEFYYYEYNDKELNDLIVVKDNKTDKLKYAENINYYDFDERGNWTRKVIFKNTYSRTKPISVVIREIKYN